MIFNIFEEKYIGAIMVIGAGVSGIQASLDLADMGFKVYLVEKEPSIGGRMAQLDKTFPTNDCSLCILAPKMIEVNRHENIELMTYHEVLEVEGAPGNFNIKLLKKARYIDENKCNGCGECAQKCPVYTSNEFDEGLGYRTAISIPFPQAVPLVFTIDINKCIKCGLCERICEARAINYGQEDEIIEIKVGAIILATGYELFDANRIPSFGYKFENVLTSLEYERLLNASGPTGGRIIRPSDNKEPKSIAFISCVGSRSIRNGVPYCSNVCCMYIAKEGIITKEHYPQIECFVFSSDVRSYGKGFNEFIERAQKDYNIKYIGARVGFIEEDPINKDLIIYFENLDTNSSERLRVQMVILAVALVPSRDAKRLANLLNIDIDKYNFYNPSFEFNPLCTSKNGIFICGYGSGPKDIPDSIIEGSAAASKAAEFLAEVKGSRMKKQIKREIEELTEESTSNLVEPRIGVIVCKCGSNIGGIIDVDDVVKYVRKLPDVIIVEPDLYACSDSTRNHIKELIQKYNLNRFIVASCTPRTHEKLFRQTCQEGGLNQYLFELVNIRDQCSWVHMSEPELATEKAKKLIEMTIAKSRLLRPIEDITTKIKSGCIIIGGGIAGMTAAISLAEQGYLCYLIEKSERLGGLLNDLHSIYPSFNDPSTLLKDLINKTLSYDNLKVYLNHEIVEVRGAIGNFKVYIKSLSDSRIKKLECSTIIVSTGAKEFKPFGYFNYGSCDRIITQLELESVFKGFKINGVDLDCIKNSQNITMIQCVGTRDNKNRNYCARICCLVALKNAILLKEYFPEKNIHILYKDIILSGKDSEYLYRTAREKGIFFIKYDKNSFPKLDKENDKFILTIQKNGEVKLSSDILILSTPLVPHEDSKNLSHLLKIPVSHELGGFYLEAHMKIRPLDFATDGIFLCGTARYPSDIRDSISQALGAAARVSRILSKDYIITEGIIATINLDACIGCGNCAEVCPFNAIEMELIEKKIGISKLLTRQPKLIEQSCKGCGKCVVICPIQAINLKHFTNSQIIEMIKIISK
ncbi:MAG: 4Fe-4S binding protein [Candidatus Helarchaeota archaeon]